ncbi:MAG: CDP-alcohol phosphatidyltransferase family protein, partial [Calditrichaeota bacterium]|nr:CDP-alcohol phosphatidyltransferase family protein [Calditrichota bacterium]
MKILESYKNSLKNPQVEEILDLIIFRPLAFLLVLVLYRLPITPNQITFLAMLSGIIAGYFYSLGDTSSFVWGAIFYGLSNVLDCSDGMIARIKNNGTKVGRIIDGFVDYVVSIAVYVGLASGLIKSGIDLPFAPWTLVV